MCIRFSEKLDDLVSEAEWLHDVQLLKNSRLVRALQEKFACVESYKKELDRRLTRIEAQLFPKTGEGKGTKTALS